MTMNWGQLKERYERFKRWQQSPADYEFASSEVQRCQNCGHDFTGNYCPYCSQKAGEANANVATTLHAKAIDVSFIVFISY